eukprot:scaffold7253_cov385-Prasinococcus_capsulatus_cf.AAC.5
MARSETGLSAPRQSNLWPAGCHRVAPGGVIRTVEAPATLSALEHAQGNQECLRENAAPSQEWGVRGAVVAASSSPVRR